jgi:hypothetical protein
MTKELGVKKMKKILLMKISIPLMLLAVILITYHSLTNSTYAGMTIIPEKHDDIPLYSKLKPKKAAYIVSGEKWEEIYFYYLNELPKYGWEKEYSQAEEGWDGFMSRWTKKDFEGTLSIDGFYNPFTEKTEVIFDHYVTETSFK